MTRKAAVITARVTPEEKRIVRAAAALQDLPLSTFVQRTLLPAARLDLARFSGEYLRAGARDSEDTPT